MIPNIVKGANMHGLLQYLRGKGRANEHTNPHVIGGDPFLQAWHGSAELGWKSAQEIADYLDAPRVTFGTEIRTRVHSQDPETGERLAGEWKDQHTWHCSLSLPPGEVLSEQQWETVSREFIDGMGFTAESGHAPARWVAIHHGASAGGNDHVHIAASMVREDGTRWEGRFRDWPRSQEVCRHLEARHGLTPVMGPEHGTASRGVTAVEAGKSQRAAAKGQPVVHREDLAQLVRSTAVASTSEAEWIRRVRGAGVILKPRFAEGSTDVVVGYRAALKAPTRDLAQEKPRLDFYGGGQLGRDLTLPRLREGWPAPTVEQADEASAEWQVAYRGRAGEVAKPGRETNRLRPTAPTVATDNLRRFADQLGQTPASDRVAWTLAARDVSGALSAWARFDPANATALRAAASVIARSAQDHRAGVRPQRTTSPVGGVALVLLASARGKDAPAVALTAMMAQIIRAAAAIADHHRVTTNLREAGAVDAELVRLANVPLVGSQKDSAALDHRKPAQLPTRTRPGREKPSRGPSLQLPIALEPRPRTRSATNREGRDDAGR